MCSKASQQALIFVDCNLRVKLCLEGGCGFFMGFNGGETVVVPK